MLATDSTGLQQPLHGYSQGRSIAYLSSSSRYTAGTDAPASRCSTTQQPRPWTMTNRLDPSKPKAAPNTSAPATHPVTEKAALDTWKPVAGQKRVEHEVKLGRLMEQHSGRVCTRHAAEAPCLGSVAHFSKRLHVDHITRFSLNYHDRP